MSTRVDLAVAAPAVPGPVAGFGAATRAVYASQLARARVVRAPLLFVAALQSIGILVLLRGIVDSGNDMTKQQIVAGSTVLVVAFVALNLLAQRFGALRATGALGYYALLPAAPAAVVLGTAASYATFTVPGCIVTAAVGVAVYQLAWPPLLLLVAVVPLAGASLAGLGAFLGLVMPKPELATVAGQLGMSAVIFLDLVPGGRLPTVVQAVRALIPSTYAADALADAWAPHPDWTTITGDLAVCVGVAVIALALAAVAYRRALRR